MAYRGRVLARGFHPFSLPISMYLRLYGAGWPLAARLAPQVLEVGPLQYSSKSRMSSMMGCILSSGTKTEPLFVPGTFTNSRRGDINRLGSQVFAQLKILIQTKIQVVLISPSISCGTGPLLQGGRWNSSNSNTASILADSAVQPPGNWIYWSFRAASFSAKSSRRPLGRFFQVGGITVTTSKYTSPVAEAYNTKRLSPVDAAKCRGW